MAISQAQADKAWVDGSAGATSIMAADLKAMSKRDRDYRWMIPTGQTSIDEFDDDTLDPAWVRVDSSGTPAANATWAERGDSLSLYQAGGDTGNAVRGLMRPLSGAGGSLAVGDGFVTCMRVYGPNANFIMGGLIFSDGVTAGAGTQLVGLAYTGTAGLGGATCNTWQGSNWSLSGQVGDLNVPCMGIFFRLAQVAANSWRTDVSPDGVSWIPTTAAKALTLTPTYVGLASSSWGTSTKGVVTYEFLRRVSGVS